MKLPAFKASKSNVKSTGGFKAVDSNTAQVAKPGPAAGSMPKGAEMRPAAHGKTGGTLPKGADTRPAARGKSVGKLPG